MLTRDSLVVAVVAVMTAVAVGSTAMADQRPTSKFDEPEDCSEPVPQAMSTPTSDDGREVTLDVHFVLDGVTRESAAEVVRYASKPYAEMGIRVSPTYEDVSFAAEATAANGKDYIPAAELIDKTRLHLGGYRPYAADVVYTLTAKEVGAGAAGEGVAGLADCIGGVRFPEAAFAAGEAGLEDDDAWRKWAGKVAAHEIAHLLGAQHHYSNCAEGDRDAAAEDLTPCTLMFNDVLLVSLRMGMLERTVVRGHALAFADETPTGSPPLAKRSLSLSRSSRTLGGIVSSEEAIAGCTRWAPIELQERVGNRWTPVRELKAAADGRYRIRFSSPRTVRVVAESIEAHDGRSWRTCAVAASRPVAP